MAPVKERRRRQRIDASLAMKIKYNKQLISTETKNISTLGAYVETDRAIPIGTTLDIRIEIPKTTGLRQIQAKRISCRGAVFRTQAIGTLQAEHKYGIGIFFRSFFQGGERNLQRFIRYMLSREEKKGKIYIRKRKQKELKQKGGRR